MERTVTELEGRAEVLEREAVDLRRENGWLKEMLVLKGRNIRAAREAAAALTSSTEEPRQEEENEDDGNEAEAGTKNDGGAERPDES